MTPTTGTRTAAQQLAADRAAEAVPNVVAAITTIRKQSKRIAWAALAAITPHAIVFLAMHGDHSNPLLTIFSVLTAALVCITVDLGMVTMLGVVQTPGIKQAARRTALAVLIFLMLVSGTIQVMAPGFLLIRVLLGMTVLILVLVEIVASLIDVDPALLAQIEADAIAVAPPAQPQNPRVCQQGCTCGKHVPRAKKTPAPKTPAPRRAPRAKKVATPTSLIIPTAAEVKALVK